MSREFYVTQQFICAGVQPTPEIVREAEGKVSGKPRLRTVGQVMDGGGDVVAGVRASVFVLQDVRPQVSERYVMCGFARCAGPNRVACTAGEGVAWRGHSAHRRCPYGEHDWDERFGRIVSK